MKKQYILAINMMTEEDTFRILTRLDYRSTVIEYNRWLYDLTGPWEVELADKLLEEHGWTFHELVCSYDTYKHLL